MASTSEIDDIFAGKTAAQPAKKAHDPPAQPMKQKKSRANRKETQKSEAEAAKKLSEKLPASAIASSSTSKPRVPETVLDPSVPKRAKVASSVAPLDGDGAKAKSAKRKADQDDEERFMDSRGTGPRRKTEEGFLIYKEDELGITNAGGGKLAPSLFYVCG